MLAFYALLEKDRLFEQMLGKAQREGLEAAQRLGPIFRG